MKPFLKREPYTGPVQAIILDWAGTTVDYGSSAPAEVFAEIFEEAGDLLFSAINVGRLAGADCEASLKASTDKFVARFCLTEQLILQDGKKMQDLSSDELWAYYDKAKKIYDDQKH